MDGKYKSAETFLKVNVKPLKLYLQLLSPSKGIELLWVEGQNSGDALINPNSFPYFNLNLSPNNSLLRNDQHHSIFAVGFTYTGTILKANIQQAGVRIKDYYQCHGKIKFDNIECYKIVVEFPDFKFVDYTVKKGEDIYSIAEKLHVNEFMILMNNPSVKSYNSIREGQKIKVPNSYGKKTIFFVDTKRYLPIYQEVYDDKGLFEKYEYYKLQVNPIIFEKEFTQNFESYGF